MLQASLPLVVVLYSLDGLYLGIKNLTDDILVRNSSYFMALHSNDPLVLHLYNPIGAPSLQSYWCYISTILLVLHLYNPIGATSLLSYWCYISTILLVLHLYNPIGATSLLSYWCYSCAKTFPHVHHQHGLLGPFTASRCNLPVRMEVHLFLSLLPFSVQSPLMDMHHSSWRSVSTPSSTPHFILPAPPLPTPPSPLHPPCSILPTLHLLDNIT